MDPKGWSLGIIEHCGKLSIFQPNPYKFSITYIHFIQHPYTPAHLPPVHPPPAGAEVASSGARTPMGGGLARTISGMSDVTSQLPPGTLERTISGMAAAGVPLTPGLEHLAVRGAGDEQDLYFDEREG